MAHVLVVEGKYTGSLNLVAAAQQAGHQVSFVAHDPTPYLKGVELAQTPLRQARVLAGVRTGDVAELLEAAGQLHREHPIEACVTVSEQHLQGTAAVADHFGLIHEPPASVARLRDKHVVRSVLGRAAIAQPRFAFAESADQAVRAAQVIGLPVVVKPIDGSGSIDVAVLATLADVRVHAEAILGRQEYGRSVRSRGQMLVEQFVAGPLVSVELLTQQGRHHVYGCTDKVVDPVTGTVELGGTFPADLGKAEQAVLATAIDAVTALGIQNALSHTELILGPAGPVIVEVNGRLVGGPVPEAAELVLARSMYADLLDLHLGRQVPPPRATGAVTLRAVVVRRAGRLRRLELADLVTEGVADLSLQDRRPGDWVQPPISNRDRLGFVACRGADPASSVRRADQAAELASAAALIDESAGPVPIGRPVGDRQRVLFLDRVGYDRYRGPSGEPALDPARYQVSLLTPARLAGQARPGECAEVLGIEVLDRDLRESMIRLLHETHPFEQLLVFTERLLVPSARLREQLGIAGPTVEQVQPLRDKAAMKRAVAAAGLPMGDWVEASDRTAALALLRKHGHVIIKPVDGTGSVGLRECRSERELADFWQAEPDFHGLVEEFLTDEMLHVDAVLSRGELVSWSVSRYLSSTMSYLSRQPLLSVMIDDERLRDRAAEFCLAASAALGVRDSVVHLELFHRPADGRLLFCEMAGRAGGAGIGAAVQAVTGFNLYQAMVDSALGQRPVAGRQPLFPTAGWLLIYGEDGVLRDYDDSAVPREWLIDRSVSAQPGQSFSSRIAGASLAKYVVGGADEAEVTQRLHRVIELCKLDYSPARTST